ncbi:MAG TPA: hypothetical protein PKC76_05070 [Saprospiraceae bacterium]|nr:hypothetical protein [Saprospiraceae bacterium]
MKKSTARPLQRKTFRAKIAQLAAFFYNKIVGQNALSDYSIHAGSMAML